MGFLSSIFDPGRADREKAAASAAEGVWTGGNSTGPGGIEAGFDFSDNQSSMTSSLGSFQPLMEMMQSVAMKGFGQANAGLPPELQALGENTINELGDINLNSNPNNLGMDGLSKIFQSSIGTATADPFDLGMDISSRLRKLSERGEQRATVRMLDNLKSKGVLGASGGAAQAGELDANVIDSHLKMDLAGLDFGQRQITDAFQRAVGSNAGMEGIHARAFGESMATEQLEGNRALQQYGVGDSMFQNFLKSQMQGSQLGMQGAQGAAGLSQLPLAFLQSMMQGSQQSSNSYFGEAGVHSQNAAMAKSPFLEALNAAGGLMTGIGAMKGPVTATPTG